MPFNIIRNDITKVDADAIVNTANPHPAIGSGTDSAVYQAAGRELLLEERKKIGDIKPGEVAVTSGLGLSARYIIHTVGPVWRGGNEDEAKILASCYRNSLLAAQQLKCDSIAFPLISTGSYGFPRDKALETALDEISEFLKLSDMDVTLVVFDRESFGLSEAIADGVEQFIDENYVDEQIAVEYNSRTMPLRGRAFRNKATGILSGSMERTAEFDFGSIREAERYPQAEEAAVQEEEDMAPLASIGKEGAEMTEEEFDRFFHGLYEQSIGASDSLDEMMSGLGMTFQQSLLKMIDDRGYTDTQVYKRANIDRKLFSKIRCNPDYKPSRSTALALAVALELNLDETVDFLKRAGLAFSPSSKADLIVQYCIINRIFDIYEINALLFEYDQQLLGSVC
ncbi:MAG: hypothetical protein E7220_00140 [Clostridiales bacterium]|nr:hypothetical protein [Clostridiales bacterium]